ncbi:hypothetical protein [Novosphingobium sp. Gsoil 351]|uniref:hypothetical protein n=1 Tax=Novosphingobium sp. Gsoil 351 TaxID=2675225 RepID=UPI0018A86F3F|nr:hypothetical protein [Novosphingobium sp. Gsoil 351]
MARSAPSASAGQRARTSGASMPTMRTVRCAIFSVSPSTTHSAPRPAPQRVNAPSTATGRASRKAGGAKAMALRHSTHSAAMTTIPSHQRIARQKRTRMLGRPERLADSPRHCAAGRTWP